MADFSDRIYVPSQGFDLLEVEDFLQGVDYPATKREILDVALDNGAPDDILMFLNSMPDQEYLSFAELTHTLESKLRRLA